MSARARFSRNSAAEFVLVLLACFASFACQPKIGDSCNTSTNCSSTGDRLCDTTQPGGYCTVFNCEPDSCPEEAACIAFGWNPSPLPGCELPAGNSPYQRSFCMLNCESDADCRPGYACADMSAPNNLWGAVVLEYGRSGKVCAVPESGGLEGPDGGTVRDTAVCRTTDAGVIDSGSSGAAGADGGPSGSGGAAGSDAGDAEAGSGGAAGAGAEAGAAGESADAGG